MKQPFLVVLSLSGILSVAACNRATPIAARPVAPAPIPGASTAGAPAPGRAPAAVKLTPSREGPAVTTSRPTTMSPKERATLNERLAHLEDALFDYDKATIRSDATNALRDDVTIIRDILANYPSQKLLIEGHADERGSSEYNLALGDKRAKATQEFLTTMGIPDAQMTVISYGKDRPICTDQTEACWQKNRRAHITASR